MLHLSDGGLVLSLGGTSQSKGQTDEVCLRTKDINIITHSVETHTVQRRVTDDLANVRLVRILFFGIFGVFRQAFGISIL